MKAIKIPNAALLDVFGRPAVVNSHDTRRNSTGLYKNGAGTDDKQSWNNNFEANHKNSLVPMEAPHAPHSEGLKVIGQ